LPPLIAPPLWRCPQLPPTIAASLAAGSPHLRLQGGEPLAVAAAAAGNDGESHLNRASWKVCSIHMPCQFLSNDNCKVCSIQTVLGHWSLDWMWTSELPVVAICLVHERKADFYQYSMISGEHILQMHEQREKIRAAIHIHVRCLDT
jgi:hypothetical protein